MVIVEVWISTVWYCGFGRCCCMPHSYKISFGLRWSCWNSRLFINHTHTQTLHVSNVKSLRCPSNETLHYHSKDGFINYSNDCLYWILCLSSYNAKIGIYTLWDTNSLVIRCCLRICIHTCYIWSTSLLVQSHPLICAFWRQAVAVTQPLSQLVKQLHCHGNLPNPIFYWKCKQCKRKVHEYRSSKKIRT